MWVYRTKHDVGQFTESVENEINFQDIKYLFDPSHFHKLSNLFRAVILEKVCQYLYYKVHYSNTTSEIPEFELEPDIALELLMAAEYLDC